MPWKALIDLIKPHYPKACSKGGRPAYPLETMLRIHLMQQWYDLSDPAMEDALPGVNYVGGRFASINCYHTSLSPGNTGIRPSSALASSVRSDAAEFRRTTSHRVTQGYRSANGIVLVSGTQAPGVRVGTAPTGRARPRTPPGCRPPQRNGANGRLAIRCPSPTTRLHRLAVHRYRPSPL